MEITPKQSVDARAADNPAITLSSIPDLEVWSREFEAFVSEISQELTDIAEEFGTGHTWQTAKLKKTITPQSATENGSRDSQPSMPAENETSQPSSRLQNLKQRLASLNQDPTSQSSTGNRKESGTKN